MDTDPQAEYYNPRDVVTEAVLKKVEATIPSDADDEITQTARRILAEVRQGSDRELEVHFEQGLQGTPGTESLTSGRLYIGTKSGRGEFGFEDIAGDQGDLPQLAERELKLRQELYSVNAKLANEFSAALLHELQNEHALETKAFMREEITRQIKQVEELLGYVGGLIEADPSYENQMPHGYKPEALTKWIELLRQSQERLQ